MRLRANGSHYIPKYSYGVYLTHGTILWFTVEKLAGHSWALRAPLCAVLQVAVPVILFHTIKDPFINVGARLAKRLAKAPAALKIANAGQGVPA